MEQKETSINQPETEPQPLVQLCAQASIQEPLEELLQGPIPNVHDEETLQQPIQETLQEPIQDPLQEPIQRPIQELIHHPDQESNQEPIEEPIQHADQRSDQEQQQQQQQQQQAPSPLLTPPRSRADMAAIALLIAYGWHPDSPSFNSSSALLWTLKHSEEEPYVIDFLLRCHAELYLELNETFSSLQICVEKNRYSTMRLLLKAPQAPTIDNDLYVNVLNRLLCTALTNSHSRMSILLLEAGASPNMYTTDGFCALSLAVKSDLTDTVRQLLGRGAKLHKDTKAKFAECLVTPVSANNVVILELLESCVGIDLSEYLYTGKLSQPMYLAATHGCAAVITHLLLRYPATFSLQIHDVYSALFLAVERGKPHTCDALLEFPEVNIEARNLGTKHTPLWTAVTKRERSTAIVLLKRGARIDAVGSRFDTVASLLGLIMRWDPSILEYSPHVKKPETQKLAPAAAAAGEQDAAIASPTIDKTSMESAGAGHGSTSITGAGAAPSGSHSWFRKLLPSSANSAHSNSSDEQEGESKPLKSRVSIMSVRRSRRSSITALDAPTEPRPPVPTIMPAILSTSS